LVISAQQVHLLSQDSSSAKGSSLIRPPQAKKYASHATPSGRNSKSSRLSLGNPRVIRSHAVVGIVIAGLICTGMLGLGLVALLRARPEDIPAVVRALAQWWRLWR
jgi:hypothetical protein